MERSIIRFLSGNEVAAILQESKVKDGSVTYLPRNRTADLFPRPAYPGVKIMCPNDFVQRPSRVSFCRVTLMWCFGSILYINCINSTNKITQMLYRVHIYARKLNCESVLLGPVKIKYYHISHEQRCEGNPLLAFLGNAANASLFLECKIIPPS